MSAGQLRPEVHAFLLGELEQTLNRIVRTAIAEHAHATNRDLLQQVEAQLSALHPEHDRDARLPADGLDALDQLIDAVVRFQIGRDQHQLQLARLQILEDLVEADAVALVADRLDRVFAVRVRLELEQLRDKRLGVAAQLVRDQVVAVTERRKTAEINFID